MEKIWFRGNPRLWYRPDLENHPELIPLEGQEVVLPKGSTLSKVIPGVKLLTKNIKKLEQCGWSNDDLILNTAKSMGLYPVSNLFKDEITSDNLAKIADQWLSSDSSLATKETIIIQFKFEKYIPTEYWMIPAAGDGENVLRRRPTPRDWVLQGSNDKVRWSTLHDVKDYEDWAPITISTFHAAKTRSAWTYIRLVITKWNPGDDHGGEQYVGLRRLWIFGRPARKWIAPDLPSPDPAFVWVVPVNDLTIEE